MLILTIIGVKELPITQPQKEKNNGTTTVFNICWVIGD